MTASAKAIATASANLSAAGLPSYSEFIEAAKLALRAIDSRISAESGPVRDEDREAYEALCRVLAQVPDEA